MRLDVLEGIAIEMFENNNILPTKSNHTLYKMRSKFTVPFIKSEKNFNIIGLFNPNKTDSVTLRFSEISVKLT